MLLDCLTCEPDLTVDVCRISVVLHPAGAGQVVRPGPGHHTRRGEGEQVSQTSLLFDHFLLEKVLMKIFFNREQMHFHPLNQI